MAMKFAILTFPGTNCERDMYRCVTDELEQQAEFIRHDTLRTDALDSFDAILLPGGSSYGDIPSPGATAATTGIFNALRKVAEEGKPIIGVCNGFQILTAAGLLPGSLLCNTTPRFVCKTTPIKITRNNSIFTNRYETGQVVNYPIAHMHGRYHCDDTILRQLQQNGQILFTYEDNPNGSTANIAGITNKAGNILGMMPHPERAVDMMLGNADGLPLFKSIVNRLIQR